MYLFEYIEKCKKQNIDLKVKFTCYVDNKKSEYYSEIYNNNINILLNDYKMMKLERQKDKKGDYDYLKDYDDYFYGVSGLTLDDAIKTNISKNHIILEYKIYRHLYDSGMYDFWGKEIPPYHVIGFGRFPIRASFLDDIDEYKSQMHLNRK